MFMAGSTTEVKQKSKISLVENSDQINTQLKWMGMTVIFQRTIQLLLLLSCDDVLKFNWSCQHSGSRSNILSLQKLPGRFSYDRVELISLTTKLFVAWYFLIEELRIMWW